MTKVRQKFEVLVDDGNGVFVPYDFKEALRPTTHQLAEVARQFSELNAALLRGFEAFRIEIRDFAEKFKAWREAAEIQNRRQYESKRSGLRSFFEKQGWPCLEWDVSFFEWFVFEKHPNLSLKDKFPDIKVEDFREYSIIIEQRLKAVGVPAPVLHRIEAQAETAKRSKPAKEMPTFEAIFFFDKAKIEALLSAAQTVGLTDTRNRSHKKVPRLAALYQAGKARGLIDPQMPAGIACQIIAQKLGFRVGKNAGYESADPDILRDLKTLL